MRFGFIEALARRSGAHEGEARRLLEGRLAALLADYEARADAAAVTVGEVPAVHGERASSSASVTPSPAASASPGSPLADLLGHIARQAGTQPEPSPPGGTAPTARDPAAPLAELKSLSRFRASWSRLSADLRLAQSRAKAPENAGPLNSQALALRSLTLMREVSPGCLNRFMSYLDALLWLDQVQGGGAAAPLHKEAPRSEGEKPRKGAARKKAG